MGDTNGSVDRRRALKVISAGTAVAVSILLPSKWMRPVVHSIVVPAHAAASPAATTAAPETSPSS